MQALFRGDLRYADRLGDLFSDAHFQGGEGRRRARPRRAPRNPARPAQRDGPDRLRRVRGPDRGDSARASRPDLLGDHRSAADEPLLRPPHCNIRRSRAGRARRRSGRVADYENNLKRNRDFAANIDEAIRAVEEGRGGRHRRHQADGPQHDRAARQPAEAEARGLALLGPDQGLPGRRLRRPIARG